MYQSTSQSQPPHFQQQQPTTSTPSQINAKSNNQNCSETSPPQKTPQKTPLAPQRPNMDNPAVWKNSVSSTAVSIYLLKKPRSRGEEELLFNDNNFRGFSKKETCDKNPTRNSTPEVFSPFPLNVFSVGLSQQFFSF